MNNPEYMRKAATLLTRLLNQSLLCVRFNVQSGKPKKQNCTPIKRSNNRIFDMRV